MGNKTKIYDFILKFKCNKRLTSIRGIVLENSIQNKVIDDIAIVLQGKTVFGLKVFNYKNKAKIFKAIKQFYFDIQYQWEITPCFTLP